MKLPLAEAFDYVILPIFFIGNTKDRYIGGEAASRGPDRFILAGVGNGVRLSLARVLVAVRPRGGVSHAKVDT
jgi:hypothetical protein